MIISLSRSNFYSFSDDKNWACECFKTLCLIFIIGISIILRRSSLDYVWINEEQQLCHFEVILTIPFRLFLALEEKKCIFYSPIYLLSLPCVRQWRSDRHGTQREVHSSLWLIQTVIFSLTLDICTFYEERETISICCVLLLLNYC